MVPHQARHGLTLVEVLAVVVILGLLAATLTYSLAGQLGTARHEIARTQIGQLAGALELFQLEHRRLPDTSTGLDALTGAADASYHVEASKLIDPWGNRYEYLVPGPQGQPFEILTFGADGQRGGTGADADISSADLGATDPP